MHGSGFRADTRRYLMSARLLQPQTYVTRQYDETLDRFIGAPGGDCLPHKRFRQPSLARVGARSQER